MSPSVEPLNTKAMCVHWLRGTFVVDVHTEPVFGAPGTVQYGVSSVWTDMLSGTAAPVAPSMHRTGRNTPVCVGLTHASIVNGPPAAICAGGALADRLAAAPKLTQVSASAVSAPGCW